MTRTSTPLTITMGDPTGIGPEIVAKLLVHHKPSNPVIVAGDPGVLRNAISIIDAVCRVDTIDCVEDARFRDGSIVVLQTSALDPLPEIGAVSAQGGRSAFDAIVKAIGLARAGKVSGIVTAPINKKAFAAAGINYPGHTEILAGLGGAERVAMMLANDEIKTVLVTTHCSLREAIEKADFAAQCSAIRLAHLGCFALGIVAPRVAVAGLNPHAGEGGIFGEEEINIIKPAIESSRCDGIDVSGPWPGDTVFMQARQGQFDVVVAQYHDQGLIPVKYLGIEKGVNITLGLPFVRTSPDHGTAFEIAGKGVANPSSLCTALAYAERLSARREMGAA